MPKAIGELPRPWAFVVGADEQSAIGQAIARLFPTVRFVTEPEASKLHQADFDAAVVLMDDDWPATPRLAKHLCVVQFGGPPAVDTWQARVDGVNIVVSCQVILGPGVRSHRFTAHEVTEQDPSINLVEMTVIPPSGSLYGVLRWSSLHQVVTLPTAAEITPFATDSAGDVLAGRMQRGSGDGRGELWYLPGTARQVAGGWVAAAVRHWTRTRPDRFPSAATWHEEHAWMTNPELIAQRALDEQLQRMRDLAAELQRESERLNREREAARHAATSGVRRLLTSQGDELVSETATTLRRLGFEVVDSDGLPANASGKQEDLRITADDGWLCLAEVKGYATRNAKAGDLMQVNKAVEVYAKRERVWPDARWYVVNQSFQTPPGQRSEPLVGSEELPVFADAGGLVIDTRDLFRLDRDTEAGVLEAHEARKLLQQAIGIFRYRAASE